MHNFFFICWTLTLFYFLMQFYFAKNPIESGFCLMLTFAWLALFFLSINLGFFFSIFIILYVSAIVVLFLFTILMFPVIYHDLRHYFVHSFCGVNILVIILFLFSFFTCFVSLDLHINFFMYYKIYFLKFFFNNLTFLGFFFFFDWAFFFLLLTILLFFILILLLLIFK